jgi:DNA-binding MarR family transcriptional regulator
MLFVRDIPDEAMILDLTRRFGPMDERAVRACMALTRVHRDMRLSFGRFLQGYGLSQGRFLTLMFLRRDPDLAVAPSTLARWVGVTRATMSGLLEGLARDGLVACGHDDADRRRKSVRLSGQGLKLLRKLTPEHTRRTMCFAANLSPEEWAILAALLARLQSGIGRFGRRAE